MFFIPAIRLLTNLDRPLPAQEHASSSKSEDDGEEEDDNGSVESVESVACITIQATDPKDWVLMKEGSKREMPDIKPIPYSPRDGEGEMFDVCLSCNELRQLLQNGPVV